MTKAVGRIQSIIPNNGLLCREVGDEFTIILNDVTKDQIEFFCLELLNLFQDPFLIKGIEVYTSISIGISDFPSLHIDRKHLINQAYYAMHIAKENGKNTFYFYDKKDEISKYKIETENELKKALKNKDFILHYQPLYHLQTGKISGMEALVRWQHPLKGFIPPSDFIPSAEKSDLIVALGEWVLCEACEQTKRLQDLGCGPLTVSVNVSTRQFYDKDFVKKLKRILEKTGLKPNYLELELTESIMHNIETTKPIIKEIKMLGIKIAIDDFGTGFSSLSILKHMPLDKLKIDKSFTDDIGTTKEPLVKSIIDLGVNLNMDVVAEGIETEEQALFLKENHCDIGQGYLFSKPLPFEELEMLLKANYSAADCPVHT
ncbi:bifunctional diguanylate cyclase/phosphodiesterase [Bacillus sp. T3]|uniref:putative bifunctional diguanylate cyclase/phosphodiesterase n=1 Tax=Bacillus sp. T3 TaxID=467262 RepID=UPI002981DC08|nr:bifunctional diguanylate cyclase/phosphodiesterase [Bacillus sp. T3]